MTTAKLDQRLLKAYQCCDACGETYGTHRGGASSYWHGLALPLAVCNTKSVQPKGRRLSPYYTCPTHSPLPKSKSAS
jgi:hypothetical protein